MSLSAAVDQLLYWKSHRTHDYIHEIHELSYALEGRYSNRDLHGTWSKEYWNLIYAVDEFLKDPSDVNLEIMKKANLDAYPHKVQLKAAEFQGYMTV